MLSARFAASLLQYKGNRDIAAYRQQVLPALEHSLLCEVTLGNLALSKLSKRANYVWQRLITSNPSSRSSVGQQHQTSRGSTHGLRPGAEYDTVHA